jgi:uncharacterized membrane protein YphA (DoxX/SURF4 family)
MPQKPSFQIEEYKLIYSGITELERSINQLFAIAIATSVTILSAFGAFFFKLEQDELINLNPAYAFPFLSPLVILIPILFILISHRKGIFRSGTYARVFYEESDMGPSWETRLEYFRQKQKGESLDVIPSTFWAISIISILSFVFALYIIEGYKNHITCLVSVSIIAVALYLIGIGHSQFSDAAKGKRIYYYSLWQDIKKEHGIK